MKTVLYKWIQAIRQRWRCSDPLESRHTEDSASQLETHWSVDDKPNWCPILQGRSRYWQSSRGSASKQHRLAAERLNKRWGSGSRQALVDLPHVVTCWKDRVDHRNHRIAGPMKSIWNPYEIHMKSIETGLMIRKHTKKHRWIMLKASPSGCFVTTWAIRCQQPPEQQLILPHLRPARRSILLRALSAPKKPARAFFPIFGICRAYIISLKSLKNTDVIVMMFHGLPPNSNTVAYRDHP